MAEYRCDSCGSHRPGRPTTTVTGRDLCPDCKATLDGVAAGMIAAGSETATPTVGWFRRLFRRRPDGDGSAPRETSPRR